MKSALLFIAVFVASSVFAQKKSPHDTVSNGTLTVTYGRPFKKDRVVFGTLEKFGKVWRVGADEATTVTFETDVKFDGKSVKAGSYTLFAIPNETEWTIILNSVLGQWGAYGYEKNKSSDVLKFNVPVKKLDKVVEQLTIRFATGQMIIEWDQTQVAVPIS